MRKEPARPPLPRHISSRNSFGPLIFGLITLLLLLLGGGYMVANVYVKSSIVPTPTPSEIIIVLPSPTPVSTIDWKTYTNSKYNFSISYPPHYDLKEFPIGDTRSLTKGSIYRSKIAVPNSDAVIIFSVFSNPDRLSPEVWWDKNFNELYRGVKSPDGEAVKQEDYEQSFIAAGNNIFFHPRNGRSQGSSFYIQKDPYVIELNSTILSDTMLSTFTGIDSQISESQSEKVKPGIMNSDLRNLPTAAPWNELTPPCEVPRGGYPTQFQPCK